MPKLSSYLGTWELPHLHQWKDRGTHLRVTKVPLVARQSRIATIGSCFAEELAASMTRFGLRTEMHPASRFYNTRSIRQEVQRIFGQWDGYRAEPAWRSQGGFVHPFKFNKVFLSEVELRAWSDNIDAAADRLFRTADVIVITLGLIEAWRNPATGNTYIHLPPPDVFAELKPQFYRLTVAEMLDDLQEIRGLIRAATKAEIVVTVSPVPLQSTMTPHDVRVANTESKARIRAAVSEFVERCPDVHYFPSYEIATTAEALSDFMLEDGRHLHRRAVDYIMQQFLLTFGAPDVAPKEMDTAWLTAPKKTAAGAHATQAWVRHKLSRAWFQVKKLKHKLAG